tara:strand:- start:744 stop:1157 length:414 start_codon:yes stop_codon:yes gene_type:complete
MTPKEKLKKINQHMANTMVSNIGIEIIEIGDYYICGKMPVDHRTIQPYGLLHGGASVAFSETLGSVGSGIMLNNYDVSVVGVEVNANHLKSAKSGWVFGKAKAVKIGKKIHVWEIKIHNENDELICMSRLTLAVIKK